MSTIDTRTAEEIAESIRAGVPIEETAEEIVEEREED